MIDFIDIPMVNVTKVKNGFHVLDQATGDEWIACEVSHSYRGPSLADVLEKIFATKDEE